MRDAVLHMQVTFDGFAAGPNGELEWAFPQFDDDQFTRYSLDMLRGTDVEIMGGTTGEGLAGYWPKLDTMQERDKPFAALINEAPKVIFSRTLESVDWNNTTIYRGDAYEEIRRLKQEQGKPIMVVGGVRFVQSLNNERLIDEYALIVHPVAIGRGLSLFSELKDELRLKLVEARAFPAGATLMRYRLS